MWFLFCISLTHSLPEMEAFRMVVDDPRNRFELLVKQLTGKYVVRDVEGHISLMSPSTKVRLGGNLTRGLDGNDESKVAIALFPVAHKVNYRTMPLAVDPKGMCSPFLVISQVHRTIYFPFLDNGLDLAFGI